jgi:hypothetical protein
MLLALKGKLAKLDDTKSAGPYGDLADALAGMGYDKRAAAEALVKAAAELKAGAASGAGGAGGPDGEARLLRAAIAHLSGV